MLKNNFEQIKAPPEGGPFLSLLISGSCYSSASENSDLKSQYLKSQHIITISQLRNDLGVWRNVQGVLRNILDVLSTVLNS